MKRINSLAIAWVASVAAACHNTPTDPARDVRMDVSVTPAIVSVGGEVVIDVTVVNEGSATAMWTSGCGSDLHFAVLDAAGQDLLAPESDLCTMEARNPRLEEKAVMTRTFHWRVPARVMPGSYRVAGRLGYRGPIPPRGTQSVLRVVQ